MLNFVSKFVKRAAHVAASITLLSAVSVAIYANCIVPAGPMADPNGPAGFVSCGSSAGDYLFVPETGQSCNCSENAFCCLIITTACDEAAQANPECE